jgi:ABC-type glycerol-3-phosphate transport system substrate-binding protein
LENESWGFTPTELEDFFGSTLESEQLPQFKSQLFSFPSCRSLQVLYYNVDWLKELGYDAPPQTWDAFREMACAASKPADGLHGFELGMDSALFSSLLATQNLPLLNQRATAYTLGDAQGRNALRFLQDLFTAGCALWETESGALQADFVAGKILFAIDSSVQLSTYQRGITQGANFAWGLSLLPHTTEEPLIGVQGVSTTILQGDPEEQLAAWLFVKWLAEPAQQARWSTQMACFPTRRSAFEVMGTYLEEHPQYALATHLLENRWTSEPNVTAYGTCSAAIGRMLYAVTAGESVDQWLSDTRTQCNQALDNAME